MSYQDDLILSMYNRGEPGLAMGNIPPGKGGSPGQPYDPPKPTGPYVPAPPRPKNLANLADGEPDPSIMNYVTVGGFFLDGQGRAYMQSNGKLYDAGEYNPDVHGLPVPLAQQMQINPMIAGRVGAPHSNVQIDTVDDITTGQTKKIVLPNYGAGRIKPGSIRPKTI